MKCIDCKHPMFEQFKGYKGHWYCFSPDHFRNKKEGIVGPSITICDTPVHGDEYDALREAKTPAFCPYSLKEKGGTT